MEMLHYPVRLTGAERAFALLSPRPPEVAAIFVHGFDGSPDKTWIDFEHLIDETSDVFGGLGTFSSTAIRVITRLRRWPRIWHFSSML
jgi:hypothetical protein